MKLESQIEGKVLVIRIREQRFGADAVESFNRQFAQLIEQKPPAVLVDLTEVGFMDSSGLGALVTSLKAQRAHGTLAVCGVRGSVASLFALTNMEKVFRFFPTSEEGLAALA